MAAWKTDSAQGIAGIEEGVGEGAREGVKKDFARIQWRRRAGRGSPHPGALRRCLTACKVLVCCVAWLLGVINGIMFCNYPLCVHCGPRGPKLRQIGAAASNLQSSRSGRGLTAALGNCCCTRFRFRLSLSSFFGGPLVMTDKATFENI